MDTLLRHTVNQIVEAIENRATGHTLDADRLANSVERHPERACQAVYEKILMRRAIAAELRELAAALHLDRLEGCELEGGGC